MTGTKPTGSILGTRVQRIEDPRLLRTGGRYVADLELTDVVSVSYVRSTLAHARITSVDVSAARAMPGVVDVVTANDIDFDPIAAPPSMPPAMARPLLARDRVRFVGEPIVAIVAESAAVGADAAELVHIGYDALDVVVDPEAARLDTVLLCEAAGTNIAVDTSDQLPSGLFADCEIVVEARLVNNRMAAVPIECRAAAARWDGGRLTYWAACQRAHPLQVTLAAMLGIDRADVRVIVADVGGSFGAKHGNTPEELLLPFLARRVGRPARFIETRTENMTNLFQGRAQIQYAKLGGSRDGELRAYELHVIRDAGAYPGVGALTQMTRLLAPGCYRIPRVAYAVTSTITNTSPTGAFRGAGRPEAAAAIERMVELYAAEIGLDPLELRRRNYVESFPYPSPMGVSYDSGAYTSALDRVLGALDLPELRAEQRRRRETGATRLLGIGFSSYVEVANPLGSGEYGAVDLRGDGSLLVRTGSSPHGQGLHTSLAMIASDVTGVPLDQIEVVHGDTALVSHGNGTGGSRSLQTGGPAVQAAARLLVERARELAADVLEANAADVVLDRAAARFHVAGTPTRAVSWRDLAAAAADPLGAEHDYVPSQATFPFGCHAAIVEVDRETGHVAVVRFAAVDDAGTILNPLILEGQIHGGVAAGISQALFEHVQFDADGNPLTANLADYSVVTAAELPSFEVIEMETPTPVNPLGAKGVGESGTTGATPAVQNAVIDALSHLGVRHIDLPLTPEKIWRVLQESAT